ncbi:MAG: hypothetical protein ACP5KH_03165 [Thermodesulfovibrio sp.]
MKKLLVFVLVASLLLVSAGCTSYYREHFITIPNTPENAQILRECQRTEAVAVGYDSDGMKKLTIDCYRTFRGWTERVAESKEEARRIDEEFRNKKAASSGRCDLLTNFLYYQDWYSYYLCDITDK